MTWYASLLKAPAGAASSTGRCCAQSVQCPRRRVRGVHSGRPARGAEGDLCTHLRRWVWVGLSCVRIANAPSRHLVLREPHFDGIVQPASETVRVCQPFGQPRSSRNVLNTARERMYARSQAGCAIEASFETSCSPHNLDCALMVFNRITRDLERSHLLLGFERKFAAAAAGRSHSGMLGSHRAVLRDLHREQRGGGEDGLSRMLASGVPPARPKQPASQHRITTREN